MSEQKDRAILQAKQDFLKDCRTFSKRVEEDFAEAFRLYHFWVDNDYETDLTDLDVANFRFTLDELKEFIQMLHQIILFANNQQISADEYRKINNQIK